MRKSTLITALLPLLLAGCGGGEAPAPGGVTQSEAQALDDAAEMLDKANNAVDLTRDPELETAPTTSR